MPTVVKGVAEARKVLRKIDPELFKAMNNKIATALKEVRDVARAEVVDTIPGLSNFQAKNKDERGFPKYDPSLVRKGLTYSMAKKKSTMSGFSALYSMLNRNAAGAIIETAGRKNPGGLSPQGAHFINSIQNAYGALESSGSGRAGQGRLMAGALVAKQGQVRDSILKSIDEAIKVLQVEADKK